MNGLLQREVVKPQRGPSAPDCQKGRTVGGKDKGFTRKGASAGNQREWGVQGGGY